MNSASVIKEEQTNQKAIGTFDYMQHPQNLLIKKRCLFFLIVYIVFPSWFCLTSHELNLAVKKKIHIRTRGGRSMSTQIQVLMQQYKSTSKGLAFKIQK